jgi:hypothetical protein
MHKYTGRYEVPSTGFIYGNRAEGDINAIGMIPRQAWDGLLKVGDVFRKDFESTLEMPDIKDLVMAQMNELLSKIGIKIKAYIRLEGEYQIFDYLMDYGIPALVTIPKNGGYHEEAAHGWDDKTYVDPWGWPAGSKNWLLRNSWGGDGKDSIDRSYGLIEAWGLIPMIEDEKKFTDVLDGMWYTDAIKEAAADGVVNGYPDGTFKPDAPITRAEVAVVDIRRKRQIEKMFNDFRTELMNR